jgi:hypothetical protein
MADRRLGRGSYVRAPHAVSSPARGRCSADGARSAPTPSPAGNSDRDADESRRRVRRHSSPRSKGGAPAYDAVANA